MIVLTGGAGFVGSVVLKTLNENGFENIVVADRLGSTINYRNLIGKKFAMYLDKDKLWEWLDKNGVAVDLIIHLGANADTKQQDVDKVLEDNYYYSQHLYDWAAKNKKRLIYASSSATYGNGENGFVDGADGLDKLRPLGPYAFSKHLFDTWAWNQKTKPAQLVGLKFFNVYGPNEYHKGGTASVPYQMYFQYKNKGSVDIFGTGEQARDFVHVFDIAKIILFFIKNSNKSGLFNAGSGEAVNFKDIAKLVCPKITYTPLPDAIKDTYQMFTKADLTLLRKAGYTEKFIDIKTGIKDYINNYLHNTNYY